MSHPQLDPMTGRVRPQDLNVTNDEPDDSAFDPSELEATRAREQGVGLGARELQRQRDPEHAENPGREADDIERIEPDDPNWE